MKQKMLEYFTKTKCKYFGVLIETQGNADCEIIINPITNSTPKIAYYDKAYNNELVLNSFSGIRIVSYACADTVEDVVTIMNYLKENKLI